MSIVGDEWEQIVTDEDKVMLVRLFIHQVRLDILSPQFFSLTITWLDNDWETDTFLCYRNGLPSPIWTKEEDAILSEYWLISGPEDILEVLPRRSWNTIRHRAWTLKLDKKVGTWQDRYQTIRSYMSLRDFEVVRQYGLDLRDIVHDFKGIKIVGHVRARASLC